jgi:hypothetical protein
LSNSRDWSISVVFLLEDYVWRFRKRV